MEGAVRLNGIEKKYTEDEVKEMLKKSLGLDDGEKNVRQGVGQHTTFLDLGISSSRQPDGWYLHSDKTKPRIIAEAKNSNQNVYAPKHEQELLRNCEIAREGGTYEVVGLLYNGTDLRTFMNGIEVEAAKTPQHKSYYFNLVASKPVDKSKITLLTAKINNLLHFEFLIKNLKERMIFTACALVACRKGAFLIEGMGYEAMKGAVLEALNQHAYRQENQSMKLDVLIERFEGIKPDAEMNPKNEKDANERRKQIADFIRWVKEISEYSSSRNWNGEDVMSIFFREFNRYKEKKEKGQVFTPEHIASLMCRIIEIGPYDVVGDFTCGSGTLLLTAMRMMIQASGGEGTNEAKKIRTERLFGIEFDKEVYALACANMLLHNDVESKLELMDARSNEASEWIQSSKVNRVVMNPPYETKYGCLKIVKNILDSVEKRAKCIFLMPDKKLEKGSEKLVKDILRNHRLTHIVKLPDATFSGTTVSMFVFEAGTPQNGKSIFGAWIKEDGLVTVKNQGRQDVYGKWKEIEDYWVEAIHRKNDSKFETTQWIDPAKNLSYQTPKKPFEMSVADFKMSATDYIAFENEIDLKELGKKVLDATLCSEKVEYDEDDGIAVRLNAGDDYEED